MKTCLTLALIMTCLAQLQAQPTKPMRDILKPYRYTTHYLPLRNNSLEVAYIDEGTGQQTLLFIHGLASYLPA